MAKLNSNSQPHASDQFGQCNIAMNSFTLSLRGLLIQSYCCYTRFVSLDTSFCLSLDVHIGQPVSRSQYNVRRLCCICSKKLKERTVSDRMTSAASLFSARMVKSRDQGDITFKCEGKDIKAHSFILRERYDRLHVF